MRPVLKEERSRFQSRFWPTGPEDHIVNAAAMMASIEATSSGLAARADVVSFFCKRVFIGQIFWP